MLLSRGLDPTRLPIGSVENALTTISAPEGAEHPLEADRSQNGAEGA